MKRIFFACAALFITMISFSQERVVSKNGKISFYSKAPMEDIEAHNLNAISVLDKKTGQMEFSVLMKGFEFQKALMQEHFNENYVESDKFPKAIFKGHITDIAQVNFSKDGTYPVSVSGKLTLHGETRDVSAKGNLIVDKGGLSASSEFNIVLEEFKIIIPGIVKDKIAKNVKIVVSAKYEPMN
jgi:polyisoprenoid-binding protein YceI